MNTPVRTFEIKAAVRERVPLLIGLMGPPGAGKTYSGLLLAEGMKQVGGGDPVVIDTEGGRSKKYADLFKFRRADFAAPFRSTDFLAAVRQAVAADPCAILIDSMSDEHEGEGGVLDWHDAELDRMAGNDYGKRERVGQAAWIKPKADRRAMINGLLQIQVPLIFCFRAREKVKQLKDDRGKMVPTNIGYQPIAPSEIVFAMDVNCVLPPKSDGVPVWKSDKMGEDFIIKLPEFFKAMFTAGQPITRETGRALAEWARGGNAPRQPGEACAEPQRPAVAHSPSNPDGANAPETAGREVHVPEWPDYVDRWTAILEEARDAKELHGLWNSAVHKTIRRSISWPAIGEFSPDPLDALTKSVTDKIASLKAPA